MRRAGLSLLIAVAAIAATSVPAVGATQHLRLSSAANVQFPARALVLTLPVGTALSPSQVQVTENGRAVTDLTVASATATTSRHFGVVLAIDASPRMRRSIDGVMAAARVFAAHRNPHHPLAAITFNHSARSLFGLTYSSSVINSALSKNPGFDTGRHLYDAVSSAIALLRRSHGINGSVVVVSDGADKASSASADDVIAQARAAGIRVYTVGVADSTGYDPSSLQTLADGTDGDYTSGRTPAALSQELDRLGGRIASEYLVSYKSLFGPHRRINARVTVVGLGSDTVQYTTPALRHYPGVALQNKSFLRSTLAMVLVALSCAALLAIVVALLLRPDPENVRARMAQFVPGHVEGVEPDESPGKGRLTVRAIEGAEESLGNTPWWPAWKERLEIARIEIPARHLMIWTIAGTLLMFFLLLNASGSFALALLAAFVPVGVNVAVDQRLAQRREAFSEQLGDTLQVVASAMRVGQSFTGALSMAVQESGEPTRSELERVLVDEQLGVPLEDGLRKLAERMDSSDVSQLALVATVQRETGGNTAEVIDQVTESIRARAELRGLIRSLTAQGRLSRWILTFLPVAVFLLMLTINPGYMHPLTRTGTGHFLIAFCIALVISGSLVIKRIVEIKV
jgi:tight adherence protein B